MDQNFHKLETKRTIEEIMNIVARKVESLDNPLYCTVSTVDIDGIPWGAPVYFGYDNKGIYWTSANTSQHSMNLSTNPNACVTLFKENLKEGTGAKGGCYLKGKVFELQDISEIKNAKIVTATRIGKESKKPDGYINDSPLRVYKFIPSEVYENDVSALNGRMVDVRKRLI